MGSDFRASEDVAYVVLGPKTGGMLAVVLVPTGHNDDGREIAARVAREGLGYTVAPIVGPFPVYEAMPTEEE